LTSGGTQGQCYTAYVDVTETTSGTGQGAGTGQFCVPTAQCSQSLAALFGPHTNDTCGSQMDYTNWSDPIVIALDDVPYEFTTTDAGVRFDLDAEGTPRQTAWTRAGSRVAFLAVDVNGDGFINDGSELFGNRTETKSGRAANGFLALAAFDDNHDGVIDANDSIWPQFLLWVDANHNGISEPSELTPITASAIKSISTSYHWTKRTDGNGNLLLNAGHAKLGKSDQPIYDVYFPRVVSGAIE